MRVDVSEIKTFRTCRRQWLLSSRNRYHLRPHVTPAHFNLGTIMHEALHQLYLGVDVTKVMGMVRKEMNTDSDAALLAMIPGYARDVIPGDLERFKVLDIEHHFDFVPFTSDGEIIDEDLHVVGSIDMLVLDEAEGKIYGFEHKSAKSFRDPAYLWMDEQPRVYTFALKLYIDKYNAMHNTNYVLGGIYINEIKKLLRDFQYQRTLCVYPDDDMDNFMQGFFGSCVACRNSINNNDPAIPNPSYFNCQMCAFKSVCETYMYSTLTEAKVLAEFSEEFQKCTEDHLDEKVERKVD